jgi:mRNA interferase HigB
MNVVSRQHMVWAKEKYQEAAKEIDAWYKVAKTSQWHNFLEVRQTFKDADNVDGFVIFNIRENKYRLITSIHYERELKEGHVYIRSFLTHKEYDIRSNWDKGFKR